MSEVRVNNIVDYGGKGAPTFDNGAVISGVSSLGSQAKIGSNVTITSGGINVSGVTTAATLSGNLTGDVNSGFVTATSAVIGSGVTINAGGLNITGVVTATTFKGDGSSMTGVAMSIAPLAYNPDVNDTQVGKTTGIGITFDHRILAGSGNVTLSIATNAGAAGTVVENFGVGSSVTIAGRKAIIDPTSDLTTGETYHISYPSGAFTNTSGDVSYVGTAYTFGAKPVFGGLYTFGLNDYGQLGLNNTTKYSSPVQVPGTRWTDARGCPDNGRTWVIGTNDGTLWTVGGNPSGRLGLNDTVHRSSPTQVPGTTWSGVQGAVQHGVLATKTDGTLWAWGSNTYGQLGLNDKVKRSSPTQIPGTNWVTDNVNGIAVSWDAFALKTDGTLWTWGQGFAGSPGTNQPDNIHRSSPTQIPGTTWNNVWAMGYNGNTNQVFATKTDGTTWAWGANPEGQLGLNNRTQYSSPVQLPGNWSYVVSNAYGQSTHGIRTDGTLWAWGDNSHGNLGLNQTSNTKYSSPVQVGSDTTWKQTEGHWWGTQLAVKTDGTLWAWGRSLDGSLGLNQGGPTVRYSSPVQVPGTNWSRVRASTAGTYAFIET